jgi:hypothetical protein
MGFTHFISCSVLLQSWEATALHTGTAAREQTHVHLEVNITDRGKHWGLKQMLQGADVVGSLRTEHSIELLETH